MRTQLVRFCLALGGILVASHAHAVELNLSGDAENPDAFGGDVAVGDFDCDGDEDLVIGVDGEDARRGAINVVYSGSSGLRSTGNKLFKYGAFVSPTTQALFGYAVAAGDFDGDGCDDVAIGAPSADFGTRGNGGAVIVAYGGTGGIDPANSDIWHQDSSGVEGGVEPGDAFGQTLTAADFDNDGYDDLGVGVPFEDIGSIQSAGAVNVLYGSSSGITASGDRIFHFDSAGIKGTADEFENFSYEISSGDFNGDGYADLVVGTLGDHVDGLHNAGSVLVLPGSASGLTDVGDQLLTQAALGFDTEFALFGDAVAPGDFNGDGIDDLAIGAPASGAVHVLFGSSSGLSLTGDQFLTRGSPGVPGSSSDPFGSPLVAGRFRGGQYDDLAIGIAYETVDGVDRAGAVILLYGSGSGLAAQSGWTTYIDQDMTADDQVETSDKFGSALGSGDFDGNGFEELLVGVRLKTLSGNFEAGAVHVYQGSSTGPMLTSTSQFLRQ